MNGAPMNDHNSKTLSLRERQSRVKANSDPRDSPTKMLTKMLTDVHKKMPTPQKVASLCVEWSTEPPARLPRERSWEFQQCSQKCGVMGSVLWPVIGSHWLGNSLCKCHICLSKSRGNLGRERRQRLQKAWRCCAACAGPKTFQARLLQFQMIANLKRCFPRPIFAENCRCAKLPSSVLEIIKLGGGQATRASCIWSRHRRHNKDMQMFAEKHRFCRNYQNCRLVFVS